MPRLGEAGKRKRTPGGARFTSIRREILHSPREDQHADLSVPVVRVGVATHNEAGAPPLTAPMAV
jgi:hypothetical protein